MGYTSFTKTLVQGIIDEYRPKSVVDLGSQNDYSYPTLPAPYISDWFRDQWIEYGCIDLNGENAAAVKDLSEVFTKPDGIRYDMVCDIGFSEHVGDNGKFGWEAIYNCWVNKHNLLKIGGIMVNENPATQNWPGHGFSFYTADFYLGLCKMTKYKLLEIGRQAAMGNVTDGWNIFSVLEKVSDEFVSLEQFKTLPLKQS